MATAKYNWEEIKLAYFESDILEVSQFLISFLGINPKSANTGFFAQATKGWRKEKQAIAQTQTELAKQEYVNNGEAQISTLKLLKAKERILNLVANGLNDFASLIEYDKDMQPILNKNAAGLKVFWEMIKNELNEPTTISKNDNKNETVGLTEILNELKK